MEKNILKEQLYNLEKSLMTYEVRSSAEKISELLTDDFVEFCSSGTEYKYKKGDSFDSEDNSDKINYEIFDFTIEILGEAIVHVKYKLLKLDAVEGNQTYTLRSSIWKYIDGKWKMSFHQGT